MAKVGRRYQRSEPDPLSNETSSSQSGHCTKPRGVRQTIPNNMVVCPNVIKPQGLRTAPFVGRQLPTLLRQDQHANSHGPDNMRRNRADYSACEKGTVGRFDVRSFKIDPMKSPSGNSEQNRLGEQSPGIPRWLKLSAFAVLVVIIVVVVVQLFTGGQHGPGMHVN